MGLQRSVVSWGKEKGRELISQRFLLKGNNWINFWYKHEQSPVFIAIRLLLPMPSKQFPAFSSSWDFFDAPGVSCSESRLISAWAGIMLLEGKTAVRCLCWYTKRLICRLVPSYLCVVFYFFTFVSCFWDFCCCLKVLCKVDRVFDLVLFVLSVFAIQAEANGIWKTVSLNFPWLLVAAANSGQAFIWLDFVFQLEYCWSMCKLREN